MMEQLRRWRGFILALALVGAVVSSPASANDETVAAAGSTRDHDEAERARERGEIRPLEEIMPILRQRHGGEVAQIELEHVQGVWIYEFKLIDAAGRLVAVSIDAKTGAVVAGGAE
jgi:uncharacterized membrane protein YkoI